MSKFVRIACLSAAVAFLAGCQKDFTAVALTSTGKIVQFTTKKPTSINSTVSVTLSGGVSGDNVIRMAAQPGTNSLYCVTAKGYLCTLNASSGAAAVIGTTPFTQILGSGNSCFVLSNPVISFDPVGGDLRVITTECNLLVNPLTGALDRQATKVAFDGSDINSNQSSPVLAGIAYQNPLSHAVNTTLYALDITTSSLLHVGDENVGSGDSSINGGALHTIGTLNASLSNNTGFAIAPSDGTAYASLQNGSGPTLYTIDLKGGSAASIGTIGDGTLTINSLVINP